MKFNVLGREVEVQWKHLILVLIVKVGFELFSYFIQSAIAISQYQSEPIHYSLAGIESIFSSISLLLYGFIILWAADFIKGMKKDIALCRSFAGADFIAGLAFTLFWLALAILSLNSLFFDESMMFSELINKAFSFILSSVLLYLWLHILLEMNSEKIKSAAKLAAVFAIIFPILFEFYDFIVWSFYGEYSPFYFDPVSIISALIGHFVFGFLLLYHIHNKKLDRVAYVFTALLMGSGVFHIILYAVQGSLSDGMVYANWIMGELISIGSRILMLGALYLISRIRLDKEQSGNDEADK